jgi:hypothetical protein
MSDVSLSRRGALRPLAFCKGQFCGKRSTTTVVCKSHLFSQPLCLCCRTHRYRLLHTLYSKNGNDALKMVKKLAMPIAVGSTSSSNGGSESDAMKMAVTTSTKA